MRKPAAAVIFAFFAFLCPFAARTTAIAWKTAASSNWNTPGNWNPGPVPTSADDE
jgi:hypothetical protein